MSRIVTFEQARRLCVIGFNRLVNKSYNVSTGEITSHVHVNANVLDGAYYSCPTVSDALDWVREEKDIECSVHLMMKLDDDSNKLIADNYSWEFWTKDDGINIDFVRYTHPLASSALLYAVLTYLEQKEKP